jgi:tRNA (guanine10-N2)-dimethyltransferase
VELLELSGEHPTLPIREAVSLLEPSRYKVDGRYMVGEFDHLERMKKAGMCHRVDRVIAITDEDRIFSEIRDLGGTFVVRWKGKKELEKDIEAMLGEKVYRPKREIRILEGGEKVYLCEKLFDVDRRSFERRRPKYREYSPPTSMHPRLARCMVNLAGNGEGKTLLDPFCGSGGILIEGALTGWRVIGSDIDPRALEGCRRNLDQLGLEAELRLSDISCLDLKRVEAIVTDPPYGRSSSTRGKRPEELYRSLLSLAEEIADKLVVIFPHPIELREGVSIDPVRVHRSLTRYVHTIRFQF